MVILFDVDGTLIGGEEHDWPSFNAAIEVVLGYVPDADFWKELEEVTGRSIIREASRRVGRDYDAALESEIKSLYLRNLRSAAPFKGTVFTPKPGAREILSLLRQTPVFDVGIATGDFRETIGFKLASAGIATEGLPFASCSDREFRHDIIRLAAERAGYEVDDAVYVGDGVWDLRACRELNIPFIATGRRVELLKKEGAEYCVADLHPTTLLPVLNHILA